MRSSSHDPRWRICGAGWLPVLVAVVLWAWAAILPNPAVGEEPSAAAAADSSEVARSLLRERRVGEAEGLIRRLLSRAEERQGPASVEAAKATDLLVECLWRRRGKGSAAEAIPLAERAIAAKTDLLGPRHIEVARSLFNLGVLRAMTGEPQAAASVFREVLSIREANLPPGDAEILSTLNALANVKVLESDFRGAEEIFRRALGLAEAGGPAFQETAMTIRGNLSGALAKVGEYREARLLREHQIAHFDSTEHPALSGSLSDLAGLEMGWGDYGRAASLYRRALDLEIARAGPLTPWALTIRGNLAVTLTRLGEYAEARGLLQGEVSLLESEGASDERLGRAHGRLANISAELGDREEELQLRRSALRILDESLPPDHISIAEAVYNLGHTLGNLARYDEQEALVLRAHGIWSDRLGPRHDFSPDCHAALGNIARRRGNLEDAKRRFEEARGIEMEIRGDRSSSMAVILSNLGSIAHEEGRFQEARAYMEQATAISTALVGADHPVTAAYGVDLARIELSSGQVADAAEQALAAEHVVTPHQRLTLRSLPERQALLYAGERSGTLDLLLSILDAGEDRDLSLRVWDALIRARALVFDEMARRTHRAGVSADRASGGGSNPSPDALTGYARASARLANLIVGGSKELGPEAYQKLLVEARDEMEETERRLAAGGLAVPRDRESVGLAEVIEALPEGSALVAYAHYRLPGARLFEVGEARYRAFVLPHPAGTPVTVDLGDGAGIDALIADWRMEISRIARRTSKNERAPGVRSGSPEEATTGGILRQVLWDPLSPYLAGAARIFIVPDGRIHLVNIAALPDDAGGYLVESASVLHTLTAERELVELAAEPAEAFGALALGDPDFERRPGARSSPAPHAGGESARLRPEPFRGRSADCREFASMRFSALGASRREARDVAASWDRGIGRSAAGDGTAKARLLLGGEATESAFKRHAPGRRLLHLATHGFALDAACIEDDGERRGPIPGPSPPPAEPGPALLSVRGMTSNPLLLSGLALAGANRRAEAKPGEEDGILTAQEIAALDLSGTQWAVLSACDTRGGDVIRNEGVFGLQRAFRIAGARTVVASLWPVRDEMARSWMLAFYAATFERGLDTAAAVREASLLALRDRRARGVETHPFYWGAFVASGDWR